MYPSSDMCSKFWLEILPGPQLGDFERFLVGKWDSGVLEISDGGLARR